MNAFEDLRKRAQTDFGKCIAKAQAPRGRSYQRDDPRRRGRRVDALTMEADGSDPRHRLTQKQRAVVRWLALGGPVEDVAARERVHPERIRRWLGTPYFRRALLKERSRPMTTNGAAPR